MYLDIGDAFSVRKRDIVFILDADSATRAPATRRFWEKMEADGLTVDTSGELPLSLVLVKEEGKEAVLYLSRQSARTLAARAKTRKGRNDFD